MGISVGEAMSIGGLTRCKVLAGEKGLDRQIEFITVMEVPDVIQWLKGNELLLTSLYPIRDDETAIRNLVVQLSETGSSALAIKTNRFIKEIPEILIEEGNRLNFPIIEIENNVSYLDIMTPLMSTILNKSLSEQQDLEHIFKWITELAMQGKGIPPIIQAVEQLIGNRVTVEFELPFLEGITGGEVIQPLIHGQKNELKKSKCAIRMSRVLNHRTIPCIVTPLMLNDELYGYVTCWQLNKKFREIDFLVLDRTIPLVALEFLKVKTKVDVEQSFKDDFLSDILLGTYKDSDEALIKARTFGWNLSQTFQVIVIDIDHATKPTIVHLENDAVFIQDSKRKLLRKVEHIFTNLGKKTIVGLRKDWIVALSPVAEQTEPQGNMYKVQIHQLTESISKKIKTEFPNTVISIGIGRCYPGLDGLQWGYREAAKAIQLGTLVWGRNISIHFDDLGIYRILSQFHDRQELQAIYRETVGKLEVYERANNNSRLIETLEEYFRCNCSLVESAEKLFIHVNTLKYRLQKIEQLTGCRIHNAEERLWLHFGLKLHVFLRKNI